MGFWLCLLMDLASRLSLSLSHLLFESGKVHKQKTRIDLLWTNLRQAKYKQNGGGAGIGLSRIVVAIIALHSHRGNLK